ncbi:MAG: glycosyltransferase family 39 protein [Nitrospinae bacterium]|nr:glycosyltransferase family 39 protein [Nitrospinota bacterium]
MYTTVFGAAFLFRLAHLALSAGNPLLRMPTLDESYYIGLARSIASGYIVGENRLFFMDPLYGYFLGALYFLFGDGLMLPRLIQMVMDSASAAITAHIGLKTGGRSVGVISGMLYALYGPAAFFSLLTLKTTLSVFLSLLFILTLLRAMERESASPWAGAGILGALATLCRANLILMLPLAWLASLAGVKKRWRANLTHGIVLTLAFMAGISPIIIRSLYVSGEIQFLPTQGGRLLYASQNPDNLTGRHRTPAFARSGPETAETDFHREAERRLGKKLSPPEVSKYWRGATIRFLAENPAMAPGILWRKLNMMVADFEIPDNHSYPQAARFSWALRLPFPTFAALLALGLPGLAIGAWRDRRFLALTIPVIVAFATMLIFYPSGRFRMEATPFLAIGSGFLTVWIWKRYTERRFIAIVMAAVLSIGLFAWSKSVPPVEPLADEAYYLAKAYVHTGDYRKGYKTALAGARAFPDQSRFREIMGLAALTAGDAMEAIRQNTEALRMDPNSAEAHHNLGLAFIMKGDAASAVESIKRALLIENRAISHLALARAYKALGQKASALVEYKTFLEMAKPGDPLRKSAEQGMVSLERQ